MAPSSSSSSQNRQFKYLAKDGLYYITYQDRRDANIRFNNERLKDLGLDGSCFAHITPKKLGTPKSSRRRSVTPSPQTAAAAPRRSSRRKRQAPPEYPPLEMVDEMAKRPQRTKKRNAVALPALTVEERQKLRGEEDWLEHLETYLLQEEGLSMPNFRSVMRQVEKLVSGAGVSYSRWDDGVFFSKGTKVKLTDDFDDWFERAVDFEDEHGRDLGNGMLTLAAFFEEQH